MKYCRECGKIINETSKFCSNCGYEIKRYEQEEVNNEEDENNIFKCKHCGKNFTNETIYLRHEKNCHNKNFSFSHNLGSGHDVIVHQESNAGAIVVIVIIVVITAIILMAMYGQQQHAASFAGQTESLINTIFGKNN